jgi:hypothetical protein
MEQLSSKNQDTLNAVKSLSIATVNEVHRKLINSGDGYICASKHNPYRKGYRLITKSGVNARLKVLEEKGFIKSYTFKPVLTELEYPASWGITPIYEQYYVCVET